MTPMFYGPVRALVRVCIGILPLVWVGRVGADWLESVGADRLAITFTGVPSAAGVLSIVEAGNTAGNDYLPDATNYAFAGKTLINRGPGTGTSGHGTVVGQFFYGNPTSLLPGPAEIHGYNASYWIEADFLNHNSNAAPLTEVARVQNHSWIATGADLTAALVEAVNRRLDFAIHRDGFVAVAGVNNGNSTTLPPLLAQAYNHITVGLTGGAHSAGFTAFDGTGRIKPDLVAPDFLTSFATPKVSTTAGVLAARAGASPHGLSGANVARVVKALLLAGATKQEFSAWARTTARPLDLRHGAGELNALLSYRILESGRAAPSAGALVAEAGWAATGLANGAAHTYFFEVPAGAASAPFSVALTWHRVVVDGNLAPFLWSPSAQPLVNLDLALHSAAGFAVGAQLDLSASTVDNVEHIYRPSLAPGRYALVVTSPSGAASTDYALAWRSTPTVRVEALVAGAREEDGAPGEFTITRGGSTATPLLVPLVVGGSAVAGNHYAALPASVLIPVGAASVTLAVVPAGDTLAQGDRTVTLAVVGDYSLAAGAPASATVTVRDKPYDAWRFAAFDAAQLASAAISGDAADPDGDSVPNLLEYALGGAPLATDPATISPAPGLVEDTQTGARHLTLSYTRPGARTDLVYGVEWSDDPTAAWQSGAGVVEETAREATEGGGERVTVRAVATMADAARQFVRLRVTRR